MFDTHYLLPGRTDHPPGRGRAGSSRPLVSAIAWCEAVVHILYLHGFASSPDSGKARFLRQRFAALGLTLHVPDLNLPDFSTLTVTRMLGQVEDLRTRLPRGPVVLFGSSLGGYVALHAAAGPDRLAHLTHPVVRLVLLAPALDFGTDRDRRLTAGEQAEWRRTGWRDVFHHSYGRTMPVHAGLYEDARQYDALSVSVDVPILIFQGSRDTVVSPQGAVAYAASRPNVSLRMLDDDHQLQGHLDQIWTESAAVLGLRGE